MTNSFLLPTLGGHLTAARHWALIFLCLLGWGTAQAQLEPLMDDPGEGDGPTATVTIECDRVRVDFRSITPLNQWDFGDGSPLAFGQNVTHYYKDANFYTMKWGHRSSPSSTFTYYAFPIQAIFIGEGCGSIRRASDLIFTRRVWQSSSLSKQLLYVFGDLEIDYPCDFTLCNFKVLPGCAIRSVQGGKLAIAGGNLEPHILPNCEQFLWNGVEAHEGGDVTVSGATISAALYGVSTNNIGSTAPIVSVTNTTFSQNFIGFRVSGGRFLLTGFSQNKFLGGDLPYGYKFCSTGSLPAGIPFLYKTYAGVFVEGGMGARFIMPVSATGNKFSDLPAGVVIQNADALVRGCDFSNILLSYLGNSMPLEMHGSAIIANMSAPVRLLTVRGVEVNTADRGIFAKVAGMNSQVSIYNSNIVAVQNGIDIECSGANFSGEASNNQITCNRYNMSPNALRHKSTVTGISVRYPTMASGTLIIDNNEVNVNIPAFFGPPVMPQIEPRGIHVASVVPVTNTAAFNFAVYDNRITLTAAVEGVRIGNVINGTLEGNQIAFLAPSQTLSFGLYAFRVIGGSDHILRCNTITASEVLPTLGLYSQGSARIKVEGNKTSLVSGLTFQGDHSTSAYVGGNQLEYLTYGEEISHGIYYNNAVTGPQYLTGNQWVGDFFHGAYFGGENSYCSSLYTVSSAANVGSSTSNPIVTNYIDDDCNFWFTIDPSASESSPLNSCIGGSSSTSNGVTGANATDMVLLSDGLSGLAEGYAWSVETGLYQKFSEHPEWTVGLPLIQGFVQSKGGQPVGQISGLRKSLASISYTNPTLLAELEELRTEKNILLETLSERADAIEINPSTIAELSTLQTSLHTTEALGISLYVQWESSVESMANIFKAQNMEIACSTQPCLNEKWLYDCIRSKSWGKI